MRASEKPSSSEINLITEEHQGIWMAEQEFINMLREGNPNYLNALAHSYSLSSGPHLASTCNEILLMEYLLAHTADKKERAFLLNHYLDSFKGTVYCQTMFAEYEMITNRMAEEGQSLTAEALTKVYYDLNSKYYGPDMVSDPEIGVEWARIPHFYYNFYVYQYATSFSAAMVMAHNILKEGAPAVERYNKVPFRRLLHAPG